MPNEHEVTSKKNIFKRSLYKLQHLNKKEKSNIDKTLSYIIIIGLSIFFLVPLIWMILTAFKTPDEVLKNVLFPKSLNFNNFRKALTDIPFGQYVFNSLFYAVFATIGVIISTTLTAYAFAKLNFPFKNGLFLIMISTMIIPTMVLQIPLYGLYNQLGWIDTYNPLIIPSYFAVGCVANIFLLRQTFMGIPDSLSESAKMDGASAFAIFRTIMLPLARSMIIIIGIMSFMNFWNDFYNPLLYINNSNYFPISLGIKAFATQYSQQYHLMMAATLIITAPTIILFFIAQKQIMQSVVHSGVKG